MQDQSLAVQSLDGRRERLRCCRAVPSRCMLRKQMHKLDRGISHEHALLLEQARLTIPASSRDTPPQDPSEGATGLLKTL